MPIYTYVCTKCGDKFDILVGVTSQQEKPKCKKCGSRNIKRAIETFSMSVCSEKSSNSGSSCPTGTCPLV